MGTRRAPGRRWSFLSVIAVLAAVVGVALVRFLPGFETPPGEGWVLIGSIQAVRAEGVISLPEVPAYVVADPPGTPITLLARSTHLGKRITYCRSSRWFEDRAHGSKFDRLGNYVLGPAARGLDRLATVVQDGVVWVNPTDIMRGAPRVAYNDELPDGPFCSGRD